MYKIVVDEQGVIKLDNNGTQTNLGLISDAEASAIRNAGKRKLNSEAREAMTLMSAGMLVQALRGVKLRTKKKAK